MREWMCSLYRAYLVGICLSKLGIYERIQSTYRYETDMVPTEVFDNSRFTFSVTEKKRRANVMTQFPDLKIIKYLKRNVSERKYAQILNRPAMSTYIAYIPYVFAQNFSNAANTYQELQCKDVLREKG